jgi:TnpA family transposase
MASIERTAYPRLRPLLSTEELQTFYELTEPERHFIRQSARGNRQRLTLAVLVKTRQQLGYFPALGDVPEQLVNHLTEQLGFSDPMDLLDETRLKPTLHRYRTTIRTFLGSQPYSSQDQERVEQAVCTAATTMSDPADLINVAVETLVQNEIELPAFSTLDRLVNHLRQQVHDQLYRQITAPLTAAQKTTLDVLLKVLPGEKETGFNRLKQTPGPPTLHYLRQWADRLGQLDALLDPTPFLRDIPHTKIRQFAAEATALDVGDLRVVQQVGKRHTLLLCLLHQAQSNTRDELTEMFLRRMKRLHHGAQEQLRLLQEKHRTLEESLIGVLGQVLVQAKEDVSDTALGQRVRQLLAAQGGQEHLEQQYESVAAYHQNNYLSLLWPLHARHRALLFRVLDLLCIESATQDTDVLEALDFVRRYRHSRRETVPFEVDLRFTSPRWVQVIQIREQGEMVLNRRALEVCIFTHIAQALQQGDLYVVGTQTHADYRAQLLPLATCQVRLADYCQALGLPDSGRALVATLRDQLTHRAQSLDAHFPDNTELTIDPDGKPHLKRPSATALPEGLKAFEQAVGDRMPERHLLDILKDVQHWAQYTRHFGPASGADPKLSDATQRYLFTVFGYGCNLGASETARHAPATINRQTMRRINAQHINTTKLEAALKDVIDEYARFELPRFWGQGQVAIADGTHIELRENTLLGERHLRYGKYGGIAYHHISDTYIALFSTFIACGVWEAVYILDALLKNTSAFQPDTLHADTHGQSEPVFGLARLLGIKLMPRMRTWNDVTFYRPDKNTPYKHINALFTQTVDWHLIETHWPDMMQVVLSIQAGLVLPSMLLRKLGTHNRKSKLYRAFRELGRVERTLFLLDYISKADIRQSIQAETTKIESYHAFLDWITFGGPVLKSGDPVEQAKQIKYMNLVANAVMLHNVVDLTDVLHQMAHEGYPITPERVQRLSPYVRQHIRRFGQYVLDMEDPSDPLQPKPVPLTTRPN